MRISDWSSDVCSSDLQFVHFQRDDGNHNVRGASVRSRSTAHRNRPFAITRTRSMTRFAPAFHKGPALVAFITGGDGDTAANLDALVAGGADVIEIGVPFTDPMADGPAIKAANLPSPPTGTTHAQRFSI